MFLSRNRARIGLHQCRLLRLKGVKRFNFFEFFVNLAMILYLSGDVGKIQDRKVIIQAKLPHPLFPIFDGNFSLFHFNVQNLLHKVDITEQLLSNFDVISLTETWLHETITNQDIAFNNFQLPFRRDRVGDSHGGIAVYVKTGISCKLRGDLKLANIECLWLEANLRYIGWNLL